MERRLSASATPPETNFTDAAEWGKTETGGLLMDWVEGLVVMAVLEKWEGCEQSQEQQKEEEDCVQDLMKRIRYPLAR